MTLEAPGWKAIDAALDRLYGGQEPRQWEALLRFDRGGSEPLDALGCYDAGDHWHLVSYGLSELYEKVSDLPGQSGWGFELTFRLARPPGEAAPPLWPLALLQGLARYVFETGNALAVGDAMDLQGPLGGQATALGGALFAEDPRLGALETPHGRLLFTQVVGVTADELEAARDWSGAGLLAALRARSPLLVTDLARTSLRADPDFEREVDRGRARDGSAQAEAAAELVAWESADQENVRLTLSRAAVPDLARGLRGRIPHGRRFELTGPDQVLVLEPGERADWRRDRARLVVSLPAALALRLAEALPARPGSLVLEELPFLEVVVVG